MVERRIKEAKFPAVKSLDSFDFTAIPSLNKTLVLELARSEYVTRRENIIAVGNSGTGKTHICLDSVSRPARRGCRSASIPLRLSSMSCWRLATRNDCFACSGSSPSASGEHRSNATLWTGRSAALVQRPFRLR